MGNILPFRAGFINVNYFRAGFQKCFSPGATIRLDMCKIVIGIPFAIGLRPRPSIKDIGGLIAIEYGDHTSLNNLSVYLTVNKMISPLIGLTSCTPLG